MSNRYIYMCAACALILGSCTSTQDVTDAANAKATGSEFSKELHKGYVSLAKAELKEGDQKDAKYFSMKAKEAATGKSVSPDDFKIRNISGKSQKPLSNARVRLVSALGSKEAKKKPGTAAKAQTMFDCWMQEQEEGWQPKDIKACKKGFKKAMAALAPKKKKKKKSKRASGSPFVVFFKFDKATLTERSEGALYDIMQEVRQHKPKNVTIVAYTDLSGAKGHNMKLAEERAKALEEKLKSAGAKNVTMEAKGPVDPVVNTPKPNQPNRRALIVFSK